MSKTNDSPNHAAAPDDDLLVLAGESRRRVYEAYNSGLPVYYDGVNYYWRPLDYSDARNRYVSSGVGRCCTAVRIDHSLHGPMRSIEAFEATAKAIYRMTMASDHPCYCDREGA